MRYVPVLAGEVFDGLYQGVAEKVKVMKGEYLTALMRISAQPPAGSNSLTIEQAKSNPIVKRHHYHNALDPIDRIIAEAVSESGLPEDRKLKIQKEKSTYRKASLLCEIIKEYSIAFPIMDTSIEKFKSLAKQAQGLDEHQSRLTRLKDEYMQFASDTTRISSMRAMAAQVARKLEAAERAFYQPNGRHQ